ncbi:MAG: tRNA methyltransferase, has a role in tRNA modification [Pleopsidium flavum]|nr:MAG: tRNA methyltransferase, has a role in tRNA modification [Pleopsidium flavum]
MHHQGSPEHYQCTQLSVDDRSKANSSAYEQQHVHNIYQQIAPHFSSTRYKPWPIVESFLNGLADGSIGLDVGCGNGKYLCVNPNVFMVASDRSEALVNIAAKHEPHSAIVADILMLPHPASFFDFAISVAVIHHLSTTPRRILAIAAILETLKPGSTSASSGKALLCVWALEQKESRRGWDQDDEQDVMVPWIMREKSVKENEKSAKTFHRYYHLYRSGELQSDISAAGGTVLDSGYEKDNWWAIAMRSTTCVTQG